MPSYKDRGEVFFCTFLPCFLLPFQTPACLRWTAIVCRVSGSQDNAECWCLHVCFQDSKVPNPQLCLMSWQLSYAGTIPCTNQRPAAAPLSMASPGLHLQPLQLCAHTPQFTIVGTKVWISREAAASLCNGLTFEAKKIEDRMLPSNTWCSPSLAHSSTRLSQNWTTELKKDSYSPTENSSHALPWARDSQPQDQDSTLVIPACSARKALSALQPPCAASSGKATSVRGLQGMLLQPAHDAFSSWWTKPQLLQSS